jgi:hypothetical protein
MPDRRRDIRFRLMDLAEGTVKVFLDVIVQPHHKDEWIAMSREPARTGETLMLDMVVDEEDGGESRERIPVCVIDSCPVIFDGDMRHRIRLHGGDLAPALIERQIRRG